MRVIIKLVGAFAIVGVMCGLAAEGDAEWRESGMTDYGLLVVGGGLELMCAAALFLLLVWSPARPVE